ncbi:hypothetical protein FRX31_011600 [Thalictrum thalictroides]|uniref:K-box domain-containing protein n=1 Tax=Thalictrum thalictroides TaxID=46969 RepID=A0A7J6WQT0_THATH|nr:hypothetical protein FRX31_011600 [Thalictrum thalictroides]
MPKKEISRYPDNWKVKSPDLHWPVDWITNCLPAFKLPIDWRLKPFQSSRMECKLPEFFHCPVDQSKAYAFPVVLSCTLDVHWLNSETKRKSIGEKLLGEDLASCSTDELQQLESQLEKSLRIVREKKTELYMHADNRTAKEKEMMLTEGNAMLCDKELHYVSGEVKL